VPVTDAYIKAALLKGAQELQLDPSDTRFDTWNPKADLCTSGFWFGVGCEDWRPSKRLLKIDVGEFLPLVKSPKGQLPAAWGALGKYVSSITIIFGWGDLGYLHPEGGATGHWGFLANDMCQLARPYIPDTWANLTGLTFLGLKNLGLKGAVPLQMLGALPKLSNLDLSNNEFTALPPPQTDHFPQLRYLALTNNRLGQAPLPEFEEGSLPNLLLLDISNNTIRGKVPASYGSTLKMLYGMNLEGNLFDTLEVNEDAFPHLQLLHMSHNQLSGKMPNVLLLKQLTMVDFSYNSLTALPDVWWHNMPISTAPHRLANTLEVLAAHNNITGSLPPLVPNPKSFKLAVDLSFNDISGNINASLPNGGSTRHSYLLASHNRLTGPLPVGLMRWFSGVVDLSHNMLSGPCCPETWRKWESLRGLYLNHNMLQGPLPSTYSNWAGLYVLDLSSNPLNTTIPDAFFGAHLFKHPTASNASTCCTTNAFELYLNNCSLYGTLPTTWLESYLVTGKYLAFHDNSDLHGCLPPSRNACLKPQRFCNDPSALQLVYSNASCDACFVCDELTENVVWERVPWPYFYPRAIHRYNCSSLGNFYASSRRMDGVTSCDALYAWPNMTAIVERPCTADWCNALAGTQVTGVCRA
jgi:Leucine-rich repeat (LRR) protein